MWSFTRHFSRLTFRRPRPAAPRAPSRGAAKAYRPQLEPLEDRIVLNVTGTQANAVFTTNGHTYAVTAAFTGNPSGPQSEAVNGTLRVTLTENGVGVQNYPITLQLEDGPDATILASIGPWVNDFPVITQTLHTINNGTVSVGETTTALDPNIGPLPILPNTYGQFFLDVVVPGLNTNGDALLRVPLYGIHGYLNAVPPTDLAVPINSSSSGLFKAGVGDDYQIGVASTPVTFQVNTGPGGAGGSFAGGSMTATAVTNSVGTAIAPQFFPNGVGGAYTVTAFVAGEEPYAGLATYNVTNTFTTLSPADVTVTYNTAAQGVTLTAGLGDDLGRTVHGGTVTFAVNGIGSFTSGPVSNGSASVFFNLPGGATAGSYAITASYSGTSDFSSGSGTAALRVAQATPTVSVTDTGGAYDGLPSAASATVAGTDGQQGASLEGVVPSFEYLQLKADGNETDLGSQAPTAAGDYQVIAFFAGSTDYTAASNTAAFSIGRATPTVSVTDAGGTYNGSPYPAASATVAGVGGQPGASLEGVGLSLDYVRVKPDGSETDLGSQAPTAAGDYHVTASFAGSADYTAASNTAAFSIGRATPTVSVTDAGGTYNGSPYPAASATVAGTDGQQGASLEGVGLSLDYLQLNADGSETDLGSQAPTAAGDYHVTASFAGSADYMPATASANFSIAQATPLFSLLSSPTITYGTAAVILSGRLSLGTLIPTGSVGITLNGVMQTATVGSDGSFSASFGTLALAPGAYAISYVYAGDPNFTGASGAGALDVAYGAQVQFDNTRPVQSGRALPIRVELTDAAGADVSSATVPVQGVSLLAADGTPRTLAARGQSNPNNLFRYDPTLGGYVFNLDTSGLTSGTYRLFYRAGNDPTLHALTFVVR
jgi:hypothetical protein